MSWRIGPLVLVLIFLLAACRGRAPASEIVVFAAADLRDAFAELVPQFEERCRCTVRVSFGSSGRLAGQIQEGAPADVFFSADQRYVAVLAQEGSLTPAGPRVYAIGRLALAWAKGRPNPPAGVEDLVRADIRRVVIANPEHAPYGRAAREALESLGLWDVLLPKIVLAENAAQAVQYVEAGDADAGLVPLPLVIGRGSIGSRLVDASLHTPIVQSVGVLSRAREVDLAEQLVQFVLGPDGKAVLVRYGFELPEAEGGP